VVTLQEPRANCSCRQKEQHDGIPPPTANYVLIISLCVATRLFLTLIPIFLLLSSQEKPILTSPTSTLKQTAHKQPSKVSFR